MKTWKIRSSNHAAARKLADALKLPPALARILASRGYATPEQASAFLYATLEDVSRPFELPNLGAAVDVIAETLAEGGSIAIYGDYDVDGICASTLMREVFSWLGVDVRAYVPSRLKEGYGMNAGALDKLQSEGIALVVTVDNGIASRELVNTYKAKGLRFVVTDHHQLPEQLPDCVVVNPLLAPSVLAPYRRLCGCGVAYFLAMGLLQRLAPALYDEEHRRALLDLVAVATVADLVPLVDDNRILVREGLRRIGEKPRPGLAALVQLMCGEAGVKASDIAFRIAPCINACGRLDETSDALALFAPKPEGDITALAEKVRDYNETRKTMERTITKEAIAQFEDFTGRLHCAIAVGENWHPGVIGIVASRLVEHFQCPAIVLTTSKEKPDVYTGSARSVKGFHLYEGLDAVSEHLLQFGGHEMAAGLSLKKENLEAFKTAFRAVAARYETEMAEENILWIDDVITLDEADAALEEALRLLEPCGCENAEPLFALEHQWRFEHQPVGSEGDHLRLRFKDSQGETIPAIAFRWGHYEFSEKHRYDFAFHLEEHCFRGICGIQLQVTDIMPSWQAEEAPLLRTFMAQGGNYLGAVTGIADQPRFYTKLKGVSFDDRQSIIAHLSAGEELALLREHQNPADANAIACLTQGGEKIGYLSREIAAQLAPLMDLGAIYSAHLEQITGDDDTMRGVNILVQSAQAEAERTQAAETVVEWDALAQEDLLAFLTDAFIEDGALLPIQEAAIANILERHEDTAVIMPTGRGKSLIYQLAAAVLARREKRMTVVISPLKALIADQYLALCDHLVPLGYRIYKGNGDLSQEERAQLYAALEEGSVDVLFVTPEFFVRQEARFRAQAARIGQFVLDEAHHLLDQRPAYKAISALKPAYPNAVWTYLTATVPPTEQKAFAEIISGAGLYIDDYIRYNLHIVDARRTDKKLVYLYRLFMHPEKTICYVNSRKQAFGLSQRLREILPYTLRPLVGYYHGGLPKQARYAIETAFKEGEIRLLFATTAFGEGVHIADIRNVVLYHPCFSVEAFNQLSGRCARDGEEGRVHLLYSEKDLALNEMIIADRVPSRDLLGKMYQLLKALARSRDYVLSGGREALEEELVRLLEGTTRRSWRQALAVFEELSFLCVRQTDTDMTIIVEKNPARRNLSESPTYLEGTCEERALAQFEKIAFVRDTNQLETIIRSALRPADWHGREVKP
ncbi:MAG: single-stranded-DNA-specific exonuclease RecJ [Peptococcaceae bacterium]|nr:single-stranded-DNA-specific exonuclease RecJ [Peptococcaceae bacterium]